MPFPKAPNAHAPAGSAQGADSCAGHGSFGISQATANVFDIFASGEIAARIAAENLTIDRTLTSFDVRFWRVREPASTLLTGHWVEYLTQVNLIARHVSIGRATLGDLLRAAPLSPDAALGRPAALLSQWRGSYGRLREVVGRSASLEMVTWTDWYVLMLREVGDRLVSQYAVWATRSGDTSGNRRGL